MGINYWEVRFIYNPSPGSILPEVMIFIWIRFKEVYCIRYIYLWRMLTVKIKMKMQMEIGGFKINEKFFPPDLP